MTFATLALRTQQSGWSELTVPQVQTALLMMPSVRCLHPALGLMGSVGASLRLLTCADLGVCALSRMKLVSSLTASTASGPAASRKL
jgi:hypothetical protein